MKKILASVFATLVTLPGIFAHSGTDDYAHQGMMSCFYEGGFTGMNLWGWAFSLLTLVALVLLIIWLWKQVSKK